MLRLYSLTLLDNVQILREVDYVIRCLRKELSEGVMEHNVAEYTDVAVGSIINLMLFGYHFSEVRGGSSRRSSFMKTFSDTTF